MTPKFLRLLGLCRRAGKLTLGFSSTSESIKKGKIQAVFIATDVSKKTEKELNFLTKNSEIEIIRTCYDIFTFSQALGAKAGVAGIADAGFATALRAEITANKNDKGETTYDD